MASRSQIITIKDWQSGIADSPHLGFAMLRNVEVDTFSGAVRVGKKPITAFHATYTSTFTADAPTDVCTSSATVPDTGTAVTVSTSNTLPAPLAANTNYFVIKLSNTTFKLATTVANANASTAINITTAGTGTQTVATVDPGQINHIISDPRTLNTFAQDTNGRVWFSYGTRYQLLNGNTLTGSNGNGISLFRVSDNSATYLFAFRNAAIDVINVFGTSNLESPSWSNSWQALNSTSGSGNSHHTIVGQDNIVYFCDDRYVGSIVEKAASVFDPANAGTYTYNNQALDLPLGSLTYWLEQLGVNLLISVSNDSFVYPWDRVSSSYGLPLPVPEYGVNKMKNIGNIIYILAGVKGNIYSSQGTYVRLFKPIPQYLTYNSTAPSANNITWGGIAAVNGKLIVGVGALSGTSGVYMVNVASGSIAGSTTAAALTIDNIPSIGQTNVTALYARNDFYQMGYSGGSDYMDTSRYSNFEAVLQSQLYRLGNKTEKATISQIEIQLASAVSGSVRLSYRNNETSAFTNIPNASGGTTTFSTDTNNTSYQVDCGLINLENIQIQVEMSNGLDLMEVRCYK